jgi:pSer/pThr/pTyr-binding forkhead associated (FHA) protein
MNAQVVCRLRAGVNLSFNIKEKEAFVGRDPQAGVSVPVEGVSRQHAKITWDGKAYWLEDLKSTNGTFLNSQAVSRERLRHLDVITLGKEVDLIFVLRGGADTAPAKKLGILRAALAPEGPEGGSPREIPRGEITLGRSPACNVIAESGAVSKVHARIERTADQLVLEDLGSANGTFVNGNRVMTAFLQNGDTLSLAGVEVYRMIVDMGEVTTGTSARLSKAFVEAAIKDKPRFSAEWKTRFDWDTGELMELANLRQSIAEREKQREAAREKTKGVPVTKPGAHGAKAAPAAKPAAPAAAKPATPAAAAKPSSPAAQPATAAAQAKPATPAAKPPEVAPAKAPAPALAASVSAPAAASPAAAPPAAPTGPAAAPPAAPAKPAPSATAPAPAKVPPAAPAPPVAAPAAPMPAPPVGKPSAPVAPASPPAPRVPTPPVVAPPAGLTATATIRPEDLVSPSVARGPSGRPTDLSATGSIGPEDVVPPSVAAAPAAAKPVVVGATTKPVAHVGGSRPILEVRLTGEGFDVAVAETGAHELGRSSDASLRVNHPTVSRKHARIIIGDDRTIAYIQDAGGANGTRLNGATIERLAPLSDGDRVGIGEVELKVAFKRA